MSFTRNRPRDNVFHQVGPLAPPAPAVEMTYALFLGGPADGERLPVPNNRRVVPITDHRNLVTLYTERFPREVEAPRRTRIFASHEMTDSDALSSLMAAYPRK